MITRCLRTAATHFRHMSALRPNSRKRPSPSPCRSNGGTAKPSWTSARTQNETGGKASPDQYQRSDEPAWNFVNHFTLVILPRLI